MKHVAVALLALASSRSARAQSGYVALETIRTSNDALTTPVVLDVVRKPLGDVLADIARQAKLTFAADRALNGMERPVTLKAAGITAKDAVQRVLTGSPLHALVGPAGQVVIVTRSTSPTDTVSSTTPRVRLSGYVRSVATQEVVRHALLTIGDGTVRRESNEEGFYFLNLVPGVHRLRVRAIGFAPLDTMLDVATNASVDIRLNPIGHTLATVSVEATSVDRPDLDPRMPDMGVVRLDLRTARLAPVVLGEQDVIRSLSLLPGISTVSDASTSFSVRGGSVDQNLVLLDEATIYNPSHILGFLSVFNTDAVDDITLYKGSIPARFGGRLASVVDIRQREGNANEFAGNASIGLLSSRASFEGPLPKNTGSFMVAGRRSYADVLLKASSDSSLRDNVAYFYDLNGKATIRLGANGSLMSSGYMGRDRFKVSDTFGADWGNAYGTLRWNHVFGGRLFSKVSTATSDYDYRLEFPLGTEDSVRWVAGIRSTELKIDEALHLTDRNTLEFGIEIARERFSPGTVEPRNSDSQFERHEIEARHAIASAVYLGQEVELGSRLSVRYGLRASAFRRLGRATIYHYADDAPLVYNTALGRYEPGVVADSTVYKNGETISSFAGLEPRISGRFALNETSSIKASYARTRQYLQLASRTNSPTPLDVWEPAGPFIKPQRADQYALGYSTTIGNLEYSAETYFRRTYDIVDFVDGADIVLNDRLENALLQGNGRAYGLELFARRRAGRLTGWVSYTLSRAEQRFPAPKSFGPAIEGGINGGRYYPSPADKTHNLATVAVLTLNSKWSLGSTFVVASGLPTTFPVSRYQIDGLLVAEYGDRNSARLPLYHRLDLSATRAFKRGELQFGVFNAYNHFNAQSLSFRQKQQEPLVSEAVQLSVFGIVPSISYTFRF